VKISVALRRALKSVESGEVVRRSNGRDSKLLGPKGVGAQSLAFAKANDFIKDGPDSRIGVNTTTKQILTDAGRSALTEVET
jgi:hypothetical protein